MAELQAKGQQVVVTAGAAGIGRAIVEALAAAGARVHICDVDAKALEACGRALSVGTTWPTYRIRF